MPSPETLTSDVPAPSVPAAPATMAWSVGPWQQGEFAVVHTVLGDDADWPHVATLAAAVELLDGHANPPEVLLLAQPQPGFYSAEDAAAVGRVAPLTRLVVVAGSWCEGELRTGEPLPGAQRLYWYHFERWWRRGLAAHAAGECPPWADPWTDGERRVRRGRLRRAAAAGAGGERNATVRQLQPAVNCVAVDVGDFESFETLQLALRPFGWRCVWQPRHRPEVWTSQRATGGVANPVPVAGIWDGGQLSAAELEHLANFAARLADHRAPVIAMLDFPRAEHVGLAAAVGASSIVGKPYIVDSVAGELASAVGAPT